MGKIKKSKNLTLEELLKLAKFNPLDSFGDIVNQNKDLFESFKSSFLSNTYDVASYGGATLEELLNKEIIKIEDCLINNKTPQYGIVDNMPEATPLLKIGFDLFRADPRVKLYHVFDMIDSGKHLLPLTEIKKQPNKLYLMDQRYRDKKLLSDLTLEELFIEALDYVIEGGNFALYYRFLVDSLKKGEIPKISTKQTIAYLKDIFVSPEFYYECIKVLMEVENPVVSKNKEYLLGPRMKGAITAWVEVLRKRGKIKNTSNTLLTRLLNDEIKGLDLFKDGTTLQQTSTTSCKKYTARFARLI